MTEEKFPGDDQPAPRVLLVMPDHWPRALLRAELIERGYDVVGAPDVMTALLSRPAEQGRGPVLAILIDENALDEPGARLLDLLLSRHRRAKSVLLANAALRAPAGRWDRILHRPALIGHIASGVAEALNQ